MNEKSHQETLSDWLQTLNWTDFLTVTFRSPRHDSIAAIRDVGAWLTDPYFGWYERAFLTAEPHRWSHNLHIHALASECNGTDSQVQANLRKRFGFSTVSVVRHTNLVSEYCSKYASKWSDGDNYNIAGNWA